MFQSFRNAEQKIKTLDALLKLELNINKKPIVIEIMDLTQEQKKIIDKRLSNFLLKNCKQTNCNIQQIISLIFIKYFDIIKNINNL